MAHPLNVYSSVVFSVFMRLGNNFHTIPFQTVFITPQNKPHSHWQPLPVPPYPHSLTTANLLFVSRDLPSLDVCYKWSQTMGDPFYGLISLSALFSRRIPVVTSGLHPFDDCTISHCMDTPHVTPPAVHQLRATLSSEG